MEKYIYRLAFLTLNDVEEMFPLYFDSVKSALSYIHKTINLCNNCNNMYFEEYDFIKHGYRFRSCCMHGETSSRWYRFELLYKDNRVSYNRFIGITRIALICQE